MLISSEDLQQLESLLSLGSAGSGPLASEAYLFRHPHLLLACGFDEVRVRPGIAVSQEIIEEINAEKNGVLFLKALSKGYTGASSLSVLQSLFDAALLRSSLRCRALGTGVWYRSRSGYTATKGIVTIALASNDILLQPMYVNSEGEISKNAQRSIYLTADGILAKCKQAISCPGAFGAITLPNFWYSPESHPTLEIVSTVKEILQQLKIGAIDLDELHWRALEEVVAELLRAKGMLVSVTSRGSDGGRDVIARGELIPGEPMVLAIEVKQKPVVSLDEVRSRLYANREFPALMFATSGRFTAGVVREKNRPENFLRMFLKDGQALGQWIQQYTSH